MTPDDFWFLEVEPLKQIWDIEWIDNKAKITHNEREGFYLEFSLEKNERFDPFSYRFVRKETVIQQSSTENIFELFESLIERNYWRMTVTERKKAMFF